VHRISLYLLFLPLLLGAAPALQTDTTTAGVPYGWVGSRPTQPAATVIFLGGAIAENLTQRHYLEGVDALGPNIWCVTLDLPGHGSETQPGEPGGIATWRHRLERNDPFLAVYAKRVAEVLGDWIGKKYVDPSRIGLFGTSRGGFIALHLAATDPRIRLVAGFAPVTELLALSEFAGMRDDHRARSHAAIRLADALHDRPIWLIIGTTDFRVGTRDTLTFAERLMEAAIVRGRKPGVELHLEPSDGHRVPPLSYARAGAWVRTQFERSTSRPATRP
jgi:pimeloyl-ACP methyl ester carboxylesterase